MTRLRYAFATTLVSAGLISVTLLAQQAPAPQAPAPQAPLLTPILAGRKFVAPVRGEAQVEFTKPVTKRDKDMVITSITVKNTMTAPIARFTIDETWYDTAGALVTGSKGVVNGLLQPGEVQTVRLVTPYNAKMKANNYNFVHANGPVKPTRVDKIDDPNAPPDAKGAKPAAKPAAKK
jgi:hypothetical protein